MTQKVMSLYQLYSRIKMETEEEHKLSHQMIRGEQIHMRNVVPEIE